MVEIITCYILNSKSVITEVLDIVFIQCLEPLPNESGYARNRIFFFYTNRPGMKERINRFWADSYIETVRFQKYPDSCGRGLNYLHRLLRKYLSVHRFTTTWQGSGSLLKSALSNQS